MVEQRFGGIRTTSVQTTTQDYAETPEGQIQKAEAEKQKLLEYTKGGMPQKRFGSSVTNKEQQQYQEARQAISDYDKYIEETKFQIKEQARLADERQQYINSYNSFVKAIQEGDMWFVVVNAQFGDGIDRVIANNLLRELKIDPNKALEEIQIKAIGNENVFDAYSGEKIDTTSIFQPTSKLPTFTALKEAGIITIKNGTIYDALGNKSSLDKGVAEYNRRVEEQITIQKDNEKYYPIEKIVDRPSTFSPYAETIKTKIYINPLTGEEFASPEELNLYLEEHNISTSIGEPTSSVDIIDIAARNKPISSFELKQWEDLPKQTAFDMLINESNFEVNFADLKKDLGFTLSQISIGKPTIKRTDKGLYIYPGFQFVEPGTKPEGELWRRDIKTDLTTTGDYIINKVQKTPFPIKFTGEVLGTTIKEFVPSTPGGLIFTLAGFKVAGKVLGALPKLTQVGIGTGIAGYGGYKYSTALTPEERGRAGLNIIMGTLGTVSALKGWYDEPILKTRLQSDSKIIFNNGLDNEKIINFNSKYGLLGKPEPTFVDKFFRETINRVKLEPIITSIERITPSSTSPGKYSSKFEITANVPAEQISKQRGWKDLFDIKPVIETIGKDRTYKLIFEGISMNENIFGKVTEFRVGPNVKTGKFAILTGGSKMAEPIKAEGLTNEEKYLLKDLISRRPELEPYIKLKYDNVGLIGKNDELNVKIKQGDEIKIPAADEKLFRFLSKEKMYSTADLSLNQIAKINIKTGKIDITYPFKEAQEYKVLSVSESIKEVTSIRNEISQTMKIPKEIQDNLLVADILGKTASGKAKGIVYKIKGITIIDEPVSYEGKIFDLVKQKDIITSYHGTDTSSAKKILEKGLKPAKDIGLSRGVGEIRGQPAIDLQEVFTTPELARAEGWAGRAVYGKGKPIPGEKPTILEVKMPKSIYDELLVRRNLEKGGGIELAFKEIPPEYIREYKPINTEKQILDVIKSKVPDEVIKNLNYANIAALKLIPKTLTKTDLLITKEVTSIFSSTILLSEIKAEIFPKERNVNKELEKESSKELQRPAERILEKSSEKLIERPMERLIEREIQKPAERVMERTMERVMERLIEREIEKPIQKPAPLKFGKPFTQKEKVIPFYQEELPKEFQTKSQEGFNVYAKEVKIGKNKQAKTIKVNTQPLSKRDALSLGAYAIDESLGRTFTIKPARQKAMPLNLNVPANYYEAKQQKFREFRVSKGQKQRMVNTFIEKSNYLIDTIGERKKISVAQRVSEMKKSNKVPFKSDIEFASSLLD